MNFKTIQNICILGGGTSAWLTAAYLSHNFPWYKITVVDKEVGTPIGVGEGTLINFKKFMSNCGFELKEWFPSTDATLKTGILYPGWVDQENTIWHPFMMNPLVNDRFYLHDIWTNCQDLDFKKNGVCLYDLAVEYNKVDDSYEYAYHVNCGKLVEYIQKKIAGKITIIRSEMVQAQRDGHGYVSKLILKNETVVTADIFVDCTGFNGLLHNGPIKVDLMDRLICDTAIACQIDYENIEQEMRPYTICQAVDHGWIWKIPVKTRIGSGIVFNRSITSVDESARYFLDHWKGRAKEDRLKVIDWTPFYLENMWHKNTVAIGLSAGFIEPLESTGIALIMEGIYQLSLIIADGTYSSNDIEIFNKTMKSFFEESIDFVSMHYSKTNRKEKFWKEVSDRIKPTEKKLHYLKLLEDSNLPMPQRGKSTNFFTGNNWSTWLIQMGYPVALKNLPIKESDSRQLLERYQDLNHYQQHRYSMTNYDAVMRADYLFKKYFN